MSSQTPKSRGRSSCFTTPSRQSISTPKSSHSATPCMRAFRRLNTPSSIRRTPGDRFIPNRAATDIEFSSFKVNSAGRSCENTSVSSSPSEVERRTALREKLFSLKGCSSETRVLNFKQTPARCSSSSGNTPGRYQYWSCYNCSVSTSAKKKTRKIPRTAEKVLDAPQIMNDFYLNVLDWSEQGHLAIALSGAVYVMDTNKGGGVKHLCSMESDSQYVSSVQWSKTGKYLAVGTSDKEVQLWDVNASQMVRRMRTHTSRVSSLAWNHRTNLLTSGAQSGHIHNYDVRMAQFHTNTLKAHTLDVCGIKWSPNGRFLASGGNDNIVNVWDTHVRNPWSAPAHTLKEHTAAVKALAWCPWQSSLLATGGGSADKSIKLWNASSGKLETTINTGSQISGLLWSSHHRELLSSHGHPHNHLSIWRPGSTNGTGTPSLTRVADLSGHDQRILHISLSPDGQTVASTSSDETLRFWKCFAADPSKTKQRDSDDHSQLNMPRYIR